MRLFFLLCTVALVAGCGSVGSSRGTADYGYSTRTYYDAWHSPYREDQGPGHSIPMMH